MGVINQYPEADRPLSCQGIVMCTFIVKVGCLMNPILMWLEMMVDYFQTSTASYLGIRIL